MLCSQTSEQSSTPFILYTCATSPHKLSSSVQFFGSLFSDVLVICLVVHRVETFPVAVQDPVPKMAKFGFLYARPGNRVLLYPNGDMVVCPTPLDVRLQGYRRCKSLTAALVCLFVWVSAAEDAGLLQLP